MRNHSSCFLSTCIAVHMFLLNYQVEELFLKDSRKFAYGSGISCDEPAGDPLQYPYDLWVSTLATWTLCKIGVQTKFQ